MSGHRTKSACLVVERAVVESAAFGRLTGAAPRVLLLFLCRREMVKTGPKGRERWAIGNNGEIIFTYSEAANKKKFGITRVRFSKALDQLISCGFLDVAGQSGQLRKECTRYAISERWRRFGSPDFQAGERVKGRRWANATQKNLACAGREKLA